MSAGTATRVPFSNLSLQWDQIKEGLMPELERLFESSSFVLGPAVARFEQNFSTYIGARHTIGANSGTSALHLAMMAAGIGPGDKVLLPSHTFVATAWAVIYVGATPVLCDVEPRTGTIDVADAERRMTSGVKAIVPVHLYGQPADMRAVSAFAQNHGLIVIEDAAQAHGAEYGGKRVGSDAKFACFSFYPGKNLGAAGEGGAVCTNDDAVDARIRMLGNHGQRERYVHETVGFNYRMEGIQGLILDHKLRHLDTWTNDRRRVAKRYREGLRGLPLELPEIVNGDHVYHLFVIRTPARDALREHLTANGIETGLHYPVPLHRQPCFDGLAIDRDSFPVSDRYADQCLSLPIFAGMSDAQVDLVIENVRAFKA